MIVRVAMLTATMASAAAAAPDPSRYMDVTLVAETAQPKAGSTILVGFRFVPKPGWHGYWSNPGDSGIAPSVRWTAPDGISFGPLLHPAPTLLSAAGIASFVHEGPHVLLARMTVDPSVPAGAPIPIKADLRWAACTATQCVPLRATLSLDLTAGAGGKSPASTDLQAAARKLPRSAGDGTFTTDGDRLRLKAPAGLGIDLKRAHFFPDESGSIDSASATSAAADGAVVISAALPGDAPASIAGVLSDGRNAYRLSFRPAPAGSAIEAPELEPASEAGTATELQPAPRASRADSRPKALKRSQPEASADPNRLWLMFAAAAALALAFVLARRRRLRR